VTTSHVTWIFLGTGFNTGAQEFRNIAVHGFSSFSLLNSSPTTSFMDVISLESCFEPPHGLVSKSGASQQPFVAEGSYIN
jgi:hypothetical protein